MLRVFVPGVDEVDLFVGVLVLEVCLLNLAEFFGVVAVVGQGEDNCGVGHIHNLMEPALNEAEILSLVLHRVELLCLPERLPVSHTSFGESEGTTRRDSRCVVS